MKLSIFKSLTIIQLSKPFMRKPNSFITWVVYAPLERYIFITWYIPFAIFHYCSPRFIENLFFFNILLYLYRFLDTVNAVQSHQCLDHLSSYKVEVSWTHIIWVFFILKSYGKSGMCFIRPNIQTSDSGKCSTVLFYFIVALFYQSTQYDNMAFGEG